jgi:pimeloyl-ACP methyl ester carboxylesterase
MNKRFSVTIDEQKIIGILEKPETGSVQNACVISCHGLLASKDSPKYFYLAKELNKNGISSIRFDFRGCGESDGSIGMSHISNRIVDLDAILDYAINELGFKRFGLFGSSMGGFVSLLKASSEERIKIVVSLASPFAMSELFFADLNDEMYEIDGVVFGSEFLDDIKNQGTLDPELLQKITCPVRIFHGNADGLVPANHAQRIFDNITSEKKLTIIPGGDHIFSFPSHIFEIIRDSTEWYNRYLKE